MMNRRLPTHHQAILTALALTVISLASYGGALGISLLCLGVACGVLGWCAWRSGRE